MTDVKGTHTITLDHSGCDHGDPNDSSAGCNPTATFECIAPPGDYCILGCIEEPCSETGWHRDPDSPDQCSYGHPLVAHECWVLPWLDSVGITETYADIDTMPQGFIFHDGPIDIVEWDQDYLIWAYPKP